MTRQPPNVTDVELTAEPPFVDVDERPETANDHRLAALVMGAAAISTAFVFTSAVAVAVGSFAFVAGIAFAKWRTFDERFE